MLWSPPLHPGIGRVAMRQRVFSMRVGSSSSQATQHTSLKALPPPHTGTEAENAEAMRLVERERKRRDEKG